MKRSCALVALGVTLCGTAMAQDPPAAAPRPKIGLVLSGGGARGAAHVGVLRVLEELRIPIDAIAANSMGALVGGAYAYGLSPQEMGEILTAIDWKIVMKEGSYRQDLTFRRKQDDRNFLMDFSLGVRDFKIKLPKGVLHGHYTGNIIRFMTPESFQYDNFDDLPIPYRCVATDIGTGEEVVLDSGSLPIAMSASMAIPFAFAPVEIDGRQLVDGMVVDNFPVHVAKSMDVDVLIAIDIGTPLLEPDEIHTLLDVTAQMVSIPMQKSVDEQTKLLDPENDLLIKPDLGDMSSTDFARVAEAIAIGERHARSVIDELRRFSVSEDEYAEFLARQRRTKRLTPPIVGQIIINNNSPLDDDAIRERMNTRVGDQIDVEVLQRDIDRIYGLAEFERVTFNLWLLPNGEAGLEILAVAKSWGPNFLRFGLNLEDDFDGDTAYTVGFNYTARMINRLGAEWRNEFQVGERQGLLSEFYQPLDVTQRFFVAPRLITFNRPVTQFVDGEKVGDAEVEAFGLAFDVGAHLGNWAEIRVGVQRNWGDIDIELTTTNARNSSFDDFVLAASLDVDTLDDTNFPSTGNVASVEWLMSLPNEGADEDYQRFFASAGHAMTFGRFSLLFAAEYGTSVEGELPIYREHATGGFLNLSGFSTRQLSGQHLLLARVIPYTQIAGERLKALGMPVYLGGSFEVGAVTEDRDDLFDDLILAGSGWLGVDSPIGPIYLGYGVAEGGNDSGYLFVGQTF